MPTETQEETLQPESLEKQDTSIKQVHAIQDQDSKPLQAQNIWEIKVTEAKDTFDTQIQDDSTDPQHNDEECDLDIPDDQTSKASQEDNYHTAMMTSNMTEYNLATQLTNHSCQEAFEYQSQR